MESKENNIFSMDEIADILKGDEKINCISFAVTPWHELSCEAAVRYISKTYNIDVERFAVINKHAKTGYALTLDDVKLFRRVCYLNNDAQKKKSNSERLKDLNCVRRIKKENTENPLFLICTDIPGAGMYAALKKNFPHRNIVVVLCDEGLGIYFEDTKGWMLEGRQYGGINSWIDTIKYMIRATVYKSYIRRKLVKADCLLNCRLFSEDEKGSFSSNGEMAGYYKSTIEDIAKSKNLSIISMPEKYVLFNTQTFTTDGDEDLDFDLLRDAVKRFKALGYEIVLKPHPRENNIERYENLHVQLIRESSVAQEILLECFDHKPKYIVSYFSTTLLTGKLFYGIEGLSLAPVMLKDKRLDECDRRRIGRFLDVFGKYVTTVKELSEIEKL